MFRSKTKEKYKIVSSADTVLNRLEKYYNSSSFFENWLDDAESAVGDDIKEWFGLEDDADDETYLEAARDRLDEDWHDFTYKFRQKTTYTKGKLHIFRCIGVDDLNKFVAGLKDGKYVEGYSGVGIFWSWNKDDAECHWGRGKHFVTLEALISLSAIDYERTAYLNMDLSTGRDEAEIRTKIGAKLELIQIYGENDEKLLDKKLKVTA